MQIFIYCKFYSTCFGVSQHPSSGVLKAVTAASVTGHNIGTATSLQRGLIGTGWSDSHKAVCFMNSDWGGFSKDAVMTYLLSQSQRFWWDGGEPRKKQRYVGHFKSSTHCTFSL